MRIVTAVLAIVLVGAVAGCEVEDEPSRFAEQARVQKRKLERQKMRVLELRADLRREARAKAKRAAAVAAAQVKAYTAPEPEPEPEPASDCDPNYSGACLDPNSSDYDCSGGSGDGPDYTGYVQVVGSDPYDLDSDSDGVGCE